jgi:hypothetical protein
MAPSRLQSRYLRACLASHPKVEIGGTMERVYATALRRTNAEINLGFTTTPSSIQPHRGRHPTLKADGLALSWQICWEIVYA